MVSELNKKIVLNKLREHGKLTSNHFFSLVKSGISKQTFYNTLSELEEDGKIIKEPFHKEGDARDFVAYSLPKIIKFEREQVKEVEDKYQKINDSNEWRKNILGTSTYPRVNQGAVISVFLDFPSHLSKEKPKQRTGITTSDNLKKLAEE